MSMGTHFFGGLIWIWKEGSRIGAFSVPAMYLCSFYSVLVDRITGHGARDPPEVFSRQMDMPEDVFQEPAGGCRELCRHPVKMRRFYPIARITSSAFLREPGFR
jgi:hypothetical protein